MATALKSRDWKVLNDPCFSPNQGGKRACNVWRRKTRSKAGRRLGKALLQEALS